MHKYYLREYITPAEIEAMHPSARRMAAEDESVNIEIIPLFLINIIILIFL